MPTFGALKTTVSRKLLDPSHTAVSASDVGDAINDAINYWKYHRLWFNEAFEQVTLTVGEGDITSLIPSDFLYEFPENGFVIPYDQITYALVKKSPQIFDAISVTAGYGLPYIYTWRAGSYNIYFNPQLAYLLNIYYVRDYVPLVADGDDNDFTNLADQLIIYEALSRLTGEDRQDLQMNNTYSAKADREFKNLQQRSFRQSGSTCLTVDTILQ